MKLIDVPQVPGIYLIYEGDEPIYLGSSVNIRRRVFSQLFRNRSDYFAYEMVDQRFHSVDKLQEYLTSRCTVQWLVTHGEDEAHWLERFVAGVLRPIYNGGSDAFQNSAIG
jgi:excinuclease UvrABC nuclease subunit